MRCIDVLVIGATYPKMGGVPPLLQADQVPSNAKTAVALTVLSLFMVVDHLRGYRTASAQARGCTLN
jgi:hypothetical protein